MERLRVLAVAAASRRVGYVFLIGARLVHWKVNERAAKSPVEAASALQCWINDLRPDVIVTEKIDDGFNKGARTRAVTMAFASTAANNYLLDVSVAPSREHASRHEERLALIRLYPELQPWLPRKRRAFDPEPRNTVLFDALSIALQVLNRPSTNLAAAMT